MQKIYVHIGLHKTATTTLQKNVFSKIYSNNLNYNPFEIMPIIEDAMILQDFSDLSESRKKIYKKLVDENLKKINEEIIFISNENISQNLFKQNWHDRLELLNYFFPSASIILFIRDEVNWLRSAYLQALHSGFICSFEEFLSFKELPKYLSNLKTFSSVDLQKVDHAKIVKAYNLKFGEQNVNVFSYEDLKSNPYTVIDNLFKILSIENTDTLNFEKTFKNKSYTQKSVEYVNNISNLLQKIHLHRLMEAGDRQLTYRRKRALRTLERIDKHIDFNQAFLSYTPVSRLNLLKKNIYYLFIWLINRIYLKFINLNPIRLFLARFGNKDNKWHEKSDTNKKLKKCLIGNKKLNKPFNS